jgi:FecR-like protein/putative zinc finger protein
MSQREESLLRNAIESLQADEPREEVLTASAMRVAERLGIDGADDFSIEAINSCDDVQRMLGAYRAKTLSGSQSLMVEAHLHECLVCLRMSHSKSRAPVLDWSTPKTARAALWRPRTIGWALAASLLISASVLFVYKAYWQIPQGVQARVQSVDGEAYRISGTENRQLRPGEGLEEGEHLRTAGGSHALVRLEDGSTIEVNERSAFAIVARGHDMTVALDNGAVIVRAARRTSGHLYVKTPDCRVAVTGTLFSVDAGIKGSRVAVLQGAVHVTYAGRDSLLRAGDQIATSENLSPEPLDQQISWSHNREQYLPLLAQFATLRERIGNIPLPGSRYNSDLLPRVPPGTELYISFPNLGNFITEASTIFKDQLQRSPELEQWWARGGDRKTAELDQLVETLHNVSQYLGDEIVIVGIRQSNDSGFAAIADVQRSGLEDLLKQQFASSGSYSAFTVLNEQVLNAMPSTGTKKPGAYALIRSHEAVFSSSIATLKLLNAQLDAGTSGFTSGDFGKQIAEAYGRGAGILLAANLHQMIIDRAHLAHAQGNAEHPAGHSGLEEVQYLIAEHRELNGVPANHLNLQFGGPRRRVASWLAAPAPIGSLDFVTPNAALVVAALSKDPKEIANDLMAMAEQSGSEEQERWDDTEAKFHISIRDDLAASLGGDFLVSLDGPVLPTPSWKAVIEVRDGHRLEQTLEQLAQSIRSGAHGKNAPDIVIETSQVGAQPFYSLHDLKSGRVVAQYAFADGYMVMAPTRALVLEAFEIRASGNSLSHAQAFRALLPKDANEDYSAVVYQNLGPVLTPLLSQFGGKSADAIRELAADSRPTAICAWGKDTRIEAASDSRLFGFDFLTLGALMNSRNKIHVPNVTE